MSTHGLTRAEIAAIQRGARKKVHGKLFSAVAAPGNAGARFKYACVVSKKIARRAVDRNRIKRLCRAAAEKERSKSEKTLSVLFYAKQGAATAESADVSRDIGLLLQQLNA